MKVMKVMMMAVALVVASAAMAQPQEAYPSFVQVNGSAEREIVPDEIFLSITITERDSKGKITVDEQQRAMLTVLKKLHIDVSKQLKMVDLSSAYFKRNTALATAKYQLELHDAPTVARVWRALDELGISQVEVERVSHSKIEQLGAEVRAEAMRAAKQKAEELAAAIGQQVGKCFHIYDGNSGSVVAAYGSTLLKSRAQNDLVEFADAVEQENLEFQTIRLNYRVQAKFILE